MQNPSLEPRIKEAIISSSTVKELTQKLKNNGIKVTNELEAVILAEDYWIKINDAERCPIENYKVDELKELPFTRVRNNGIEYRIHGIIHSKDMSTKTKDFIRQAVSKFANLKEREECLYEIGLKRAFGLKKVKEISDGELFPYEAKNILRVILDTRKLRSIRKDLPKDLYLRMWKNDEQLKEMLIRTCGNINYLSLLRESYERRLFPMPLGIEKRAIKYTFYASTSKKFGEKLMFYFCRPDLSKEYAKSIKRFAQDNKLKLLHFVGGLSHESEVAYYLQNNK